MIQLISKNCTFGAYFNLIDALRLKHEVHGVVEKKDKKDIHCNKKYHIGFTKIKKE